MKLCPTYAASGASARPADPEATARMDPNEAGGAGAREILERLARGELDVDAAARALDDARGGRG